MWSTFFCTTGWNKMWTVRHPKLKRGVGGSKKKKAPACMQVKAGHTTCCFVWENKHFFAFSLLQLHNTATHTNSKHWFTTSFLQPLPYLVTPQVPENCQLTSIFCWCSNSSMFVTNNSNYIRHFFYVAMLLMPAQTKPKLFESTQNLFLIFLYPGCLMFTCMLGC